jgi:hypothetical protein
MDRIDSFVDTSIRPSWIECIAKPVPTRLNASVVMKRNRPGKIIIHQAIWKISPASFSPPHEGVVAGTDPQEQRAASNRMLLGMISVV